MSGRLQNNIFTFSSLRSHKLSGNHIMYNQRNCSYYANSAIVLLFFLKNCSLWSINVLSINKSQYYRTSHYLSDKMLELYKWKAILDSKCSIAKTLGYTDVEVDKKVGYGDNLGNFVQFPKFIKKLFSSRFFLFTLNPFPHNDTF